MTLKGVVREPSLTLQVISRFRALIGSGAWPVGSQVPGESQLVEELGVSKGTVREALRALSATGLLEPQAGRGTYVRASNEITAVLVRDGLLCTPVTALDAWTGLESISARLAAAHGAPPAVLSDLDTDLTEREAARIASDHRAYVAADLVFHRDIVRAGENPLLLRMYDAVAETLTPWIRSTAVLPQTTSARDPHVIVLGAIRTGNPDGVPSVHCPLLESVPAGRQALAAEDGG
ncbi:FadR/GntR family transcriptional regulator [Streptomyces graminifolii]|uniref:FadR/GntR family transcriptional regulator n=1 Tax=Streptomyces graminifolii TaxID=1266771 RepID=UPI004059CFD5